MALRVLYVHVELCKGTAKNGRYLFLDYLKAVVDSTMWRASIYQGSCMGWSGCKAVMVVSVLHSSRPISGPPFLHPPSLVLPSVLDNQCCCCCYDVQLLFPRGLSNSWYSMQKLGTRTCRIAICAV